MKPDWKGLSRKPGLISSLFRGRHGDNKGRNLAKVTQPIRPCHPLAHPAQGPNIIPADIIFIVKEKLHPRFRRENDNLIFVNSIPLGKVSGQSGGTRGGQIRARPPHPWEAPRQAGFTPLSPWCVAQAFRT